MSFNVEKIAPVTCSVAMQVYRVAIRPVYLAWFTRWLTFQSFQCKRHHPAPQVGHASLTLSIVRRQTISDM